MRYPLTHAAAASIAWRRMYFCTIAAQMANDASRDLRHPDAMDEKAIRRAAVITLRRAIERALKFSD